MLKKVKRFFRDQPPVGQTFESLAEQRLIAEFGLSESEAAAKADAGGEILRGSARERYEAGEAAGHFEFDSPSLSHLRYTLSPMNQEEFVQHENAQGQAFRDAGERIEMEERAAFRRLAERARD